MFHKEVKPQADSTLWLFSDFFFLWPDCHIRKGWEDGRKTEETLMSSGNENDFSVCVCNPDLLGLMSDASLKVCHKFSL